MVCGNGVRVAVYLLFFGGQNAFLHQSLELCRACIRAAAHLVLVGGGVKLHGACKESFLLLRGQAHGGGLVGVQNALRILSGNVQGVQRGKHARRALLFLCLLEHKPLVHQLGDYLANACTESGAQGVNACISARGNIVKHQKVCGIKFFVHVLCTCIGRGGVVVHQVRHGSRGNGTAHRLAHRAKRLLMQVQAQGKHFPR